MLLKRKDLTVKFGDFTAVDHVNFKIKRGEIFGFLGSNGCGKSTTMKVLTGLLEASEGQAWLFGEPVEGNNIETRRRVGYMSQAFSLYSELTIVQNLVLHAKLFHVPKNRLSHVYSSCWSVLTWKKSKKNCPMICLWGASAFITRSGTGA